MKIVITDCDHASVDIEREVVESAGCELVRNQSMEPDEIVRGAADDLVGLHGLVADELAAGGLDHLPLDVHGGVVTVGDDDLHAATPRRGGPGPRARAQPMVSQRYDVIQGEAPRVRASGLVQVAVSYTHLRAH